MKTSWQNVKISYLGSIKTGKTPKTFISDNYGGKILFLTPSDDMEVKYIRNTGKKLTQKGMEEVKNCLLPKDAVCVSCIGSDLGKVVMTTEPTVTNQQINSIVVNKEICDANFCYYRMIMLGKVLNYHGKISTAVPIVNKTTFSNYEILLPPMSEQKKIAKILSVLDDKIELNNKINQNLELQAQTLFNEQILKNTTIGKIGDYCSLKSGFAFKSSWWKDSGIKVIKIKNIEVSGLNLKDCSFVSDDKITLAKDFIVKGGDLLIAMTGATIGKFTIVPYVDEILLVNQRVGKFFLGDNPLKKLPFIYCTLKQPEIVSEIINRGQGSAQPNISGNDIMSISCIYPNNSVIEEFNNICKPYFEKIITNQYENMKLSAIRDALLPKLMSGEIDVENLPQSAIIPKE